MNQQGQLAGHGVHAHAGARYEGGYASYLEVTTAQEMLFDAQLAAIQAPRADQLAPRTPNAVTTP
ncbi:hypothetical protein [Cupriavidus basilensis]|uniref:hypothetical protein n=1 Tax=Cupriavidus basilensis TaxID=68895 RepID=UPI0009E24B67|nr:hypothetical protein [Cupriavidus basilensis]